MSHDTGKNSSVPEKKITIKVTLDAFFINYINYL